MRSAWLGLFCLTGCVQSEHAAPNHAPEVAPVHVVTEEDTAKVFRVVVHDRDGDPLAISITNISASMREIVQSTDGEGARLEATAIYQPATNFSGSDFGVVTVSDGIVETKYDLAVE